MTYVAVNSFRRYYKELSYILIDNGGCEVSVNLWRKMANKGLIELVENVENLGHGPALNQGLELVETPYAFLLDSDTKTKHPGFLEKMLKLFEKDNRLFAAGWLRRVNAKTGVPIRSQHPKYDSGLPYIHPHACLLNVAKFRKLRPFVHHGAPARPVMLDAYEQGYTVANFPVADYIWHKMGGTRGHFRGQWNIDTEERVGQWRRVRI